MFLQFLMHLYILMLSFTDIRSCEFIDFPLVFFPLLLGFESLSSPPRPMKYSPTFSPHSENYAWLLLIAFYKTEKNTIKVEVPLFLPPSFRQSRPTDAPSVFDGFPFHISLLHISWNLFCCVV